MVKSYCQLVNCLSFPTELTPMVKIIILSAINCWNKTQNILGGQSLKSLYPTKIKNILGQRRINK